MSTTAQGQRNTLAQYSGRRGRGRPKGSTKHAMRARRAAIHSIVQANQPTGVRFTYYRAVAEGLVPKTEAGYAMVQRAILQLRRHGRLPWSWIVDSSRWRRKPSTWGSIGQILDSAAASYRRALWDDSPELVEIWCESVSVAGVLYPETEQFDVPLFPLSGQTSDSFAWGAAQEYRTDPRPLYIYYFGDHDPAGFEIETNLHAKLVEYSGRDDINFTRVACTADDVANLSLLGTPPKKRTWVNRLTGERVPFEGKAVEIEAIDPPRLRRWARYWLESHIDSEQLRILREAEKSERELLTRIARCDTDELAELADRVGAP